MPEAFGLVEIKGYSAAVYTADIMLKEAAVIFTGIQNNEPGIFTVKIAGKTADVQKAVKKVSSSKKNIISSYIIINPSKQLAVLFPELNYFNNDVPVENINTAAPDTVPNVLSGISSKEKVKDKKQLKNVKGSNDKPPVPVAEKEVEDKIIAGTLPEPVKAKKAGKTDKAGKTQKPEKGQKREKAQRPEKVQKAEKPVTHMYSLFEDDNDTIARLRREALGGVSPAGRDTEQQNSNTGEEESVTETEAAGISGNGELGSMNVHMLRKLARSTEGFPIQGREISKANRDKLLEFFRALGK